MITDMGKQDELKAKSLCPASSHMDLLGVNLGFREWVASD
jgi:hypothetical protein